VSNSRVIVASVAAVPFAPISVELAVSTALLVWGVFVVCRYYRRYA
jgi:hypothetical protein